MKSALFSRFIGGEPGFEKSKAFEKQAETRQTTSSRFTELSPVFSGEQIPEIRNGRIVAWRPF